MALLSECYSEADYHRRAMEELMRQQAYGQQMQDLVAAQYNSPSQAPPINISERDNPVLLLLP